MLWLVFDVEPRACEAAAPAVDSLVTASGSGSRAGEDRSASLSSAPPQGMSGDGNGDYTGDWAKDIDWQHQRGKAAAA